MGLTAVRYSSFLLVLLLAVTGQLTAKAGALRAADGQIINVLLVVSLICLAARGVVWTFVLRRERLVFAYPIMSLTYPLMLVLAYLVLGESITPGKVAGSALVIGGVLMIGFAERRS